MRRSVVLLCGVLCTHAVVASCGVQEQEERVLALGGDSDLTSLFVAAGGEFGVPPEILATLSYELTRLRAVGDEHRHDDRLAPIGLMALSEGGRDIHLASELSASSVQAITRDDLSNIRAAAALLANHAASMHLSPLELSQWRPVVEAYAGIGTADALMQHLERGWRGGDEDGKIVVCSARSVLHTRADGIGSLQLAIGLPGSHWNPAHSSNYRNADRGTDEIERIVIHTTQGAYNGAISWFQDPVADVSAHYVIRSSDGDVTHMVDEKNVGWHAGQENGRSVGIEHEGYINQPEVWYTETMYQESAALTFWLTQQYDIPIDREHIIGHVEGVGATHTDPGDGWDWDHYMDLVSNNGQAEFSAAFESLSAPTSMISGETAVVEIKLENTGDSAWGINETRVGTQTPQDRESLFYVDGSWLSPSRASGASMGFASGTVGTFRFEIQAPEVDVPTRYSEKFQLVQNGEHWFGPVFSMEIDVLPPDRSISVSPNSIPTIVLEPGESDRTAGDLRGGCSVTGPSGEANALFLVGLLLFWRRRRP